MSDWDFLESHDNADYHGFKDAPQDGKYYIAPFKVCGVKTFIKKSYIGNPPEEHNIEMYKYAADFFNGRKSNVNKAIQQTLNEGVKFNIKSCILEANEDGARVSFYSTLSGDENHKYKVVMLTSDGECYSSYHSKATWVYESVDDWSFLESGGRNGVIKQSHIAKAESIASKYVNTSNKLIAKTAKSEIRENQKRAKAFDTKDIGMDIAKKYAEANKVMLSPSIDVKEKMDQVVKFRAAINRMKKRGKSHADYARHELNDLQDKSDDINSKIRGKDVIKSKAIHQAVNDGLKKK